MSHDSVLPFVIERGLMYTNCLAGNSYKVTVQEDHYNPSSVVISVHRCFYNSFFQRHGKPQLTPVICRWESENILRQFGKSFHLNCYFLIFFF